MLQLKRIRDFLEGCPRGPWVDGAIAVRKVPRLKDETITRDFSDPQIMQLWGAWREKKGWIQRDWQYYLNADHYADFADFRRFLVKEFGVR